MTTNNVINVATGAVGTVLTGNGVGTTPTFQTSPVSFVAASVAQMEAGTSNVVGVTPLVQQRHPSSPKSWSSFTGTGTPAVLEQYNIASITDLGVGSWQLNYTTSMATAIYNAVACGDNSVASSSAVIQATAVGSVTIRGVNFVTNTNVDLTAVYVICTGDQ